MPWSAWLILYVVEQLDFNVFTFSRKTYSTSQKFEWENVSKRLTDTVFFLNYFLACVALYVSIKDKKIKKNTEQEIAISLQTWENLAHLHYQDRFFTPQFILLVWLKCHSQTCNASWLQFH